MRMKEQIQKLIEAAEIKLSDMCYQAKQDWQRMAEKGHENAYAVSVRYEALRTAAEIFADVGQAIDNEYSATNKSEEEAFVVGWVCDGCGIDICLKSAISNSNFNYCPNCGRKIEGVNEDVGKGELV